MCSLEKRFDCMTFSIALSQGDEDVVPIDAARLAQVFKLNALAQSGLL